MNGFVTITAAREGTPLVEAYGLLLASVLLGSDGKPPSVVAVAGARTGDGVSTTALNLALMMARSARPTALVDANLRAPELHKAFRLPQSPGLAEVLAGKAEFKSALVPAAAEHLSLMPAGKADVPVQAMLSRHALGELFGMMRERFELIVVDTPPILEYPDVLHIAKAVDGVLLVVSPGGASRQNQQEMRRLLARVEARVLGSVLNRVRPRAGTPLASTP